jgi:hypothetical protein
MLTSALPLAFPGQPAAASDRVFPGDDQGFCHGQSEVTLWNSGLEQMARLTSSVVGIGERSSSPYK